MKKTLKYMYPRTDLTVRVSYELYGIIHEFCNEMGVSVQDVIAAALLNMLDPTKANCRDWQTLAYKLQ